MCGLGPGADDHRPPSVTNMLTTVEKGFRHVCFCIRSECAHNLIMQNILEVFWLCVV